VLMEQCPRFFLNGDDDVGSKAQDQDSNEQQEDFEFKPSLDFLKQWSSLRVSKNFRCVKVVREESRSISSDFLYIIKKSR